MNGSRALALVHSIPRLDNVKRNFVVVFATAKPMVTKPSPRVLPTQRAGK